MPGRLLNPLLPLIVPIAARWVASQEALILSDGEVLNEDQLHDAQRAGVQYPERIRLRYVESIPTPGHRSLVALGKWTGLVSPRTIGITLNYGIYLRRSYRNDRPLLVHECVHVGQYERLGSIVGFLRPYLQECLDPGYPRGPMEQEAIQRSAQIIAGS